MRPGKGNLKRAPSTALLRIGKCLRFSLWSAGGRARRRVPVATFGLRDPGRVPGWDGADHPVQRAGEGEVARLHTGAGRTEMRKGSYPAEDRCITLFELYLSQQGGVPVTEVGRPDRDGSGPAVARRCDALLEAPGRRWSVEHTSIDSFLAAADAGGAVH
jgi:hypothetical protein